MMGKEAQEFALIEPPLPRWIDNILWLDLVILLILIVLNWKVTIIVWIVRFVLKSVHFLEIFGGLFLLPFLHYNFPHGVTDSQIEVARKIKLSCAIPVENEKHSEESWNQMTQSINDLKYSENDYEAITKVLQTLKAEKLCYAEAFRLIEERNEKLAEQWEESQNGE